MPCVPLETHSPTRGERTHGPRRSPRPPQVDRRRRGTIRCPRIRARSSAVERCPYKADVGGSNPSAPTRGARILPLTIGPGPPLRGRCASITTGDLLLRVRRQAVPLQRDDGRRLTFDGRSQLPSSWVQIRPESAQALPRRALLLLPLPVLLKYRDGPGAEGDRPCACRRLRLVLVHVHPSCTICRATVSSPPSRSTSVHRCPHASPRRSPRNVIRWNSAYRRSPAAWSRNAPTICGGHTMTGLGCSPVSCHRRTCSSLHSTPLGRLPDVISTSRAGFPPPAARHLPAPGLVREDRSSASQAAHQARTSASEGAVRAFSMRDGGAAGAVPCAQSVTCGRGAGERSAGRSAAVWIRPRSLDHRRASSRPPPAGGRRWPGRPPVVGGRPGRRGRSVGGRTDPGSSPLGRLRAGGSRCSRGVPLAMPTGAGAADRR